MRSPLWLRLVIAPSALALAGIAMVSPATASSGARSAGHPIRPGVAVEMAGITCSAGAILRQKSTVYVAMPASCAGLGPGKVQNGCTEAEAPVGTPAKIAGARYRAFMVYNSFTRMQSLSTGSGPKPASRRLCHDNDLALLALNPLDRSRVTGAVAGTGGPRGVSHRAPANGRHLTVGGDAATAGASHQGGWVYDVTSTATWTNRDIGAPAVAGGKLLGMLTVLPQGMVPALPTTPVGGTPAQVYNLHKALVFLRKTPGFHHVSLLAAGQHV